MTKENLKYSSADRIIIRKLWISDDGTSPYDLHDEYLLSPGQIAEAIEKFSSLGVINYIDQKIVFSPNGRAWVFDNRFELFCYDLNKTWREVDEKIRVEMIPANIPYKPNRKKLDYRTFSNRVDIF